MGHPRDLLLHRFTGDRHESGLAAHALAWYPGRSYSGLGRFGGPLVEREGDKVVNHDCLSRNGSLRATVLAGAVVVFAGFVGSAWAACPTAPCTSNPQCNDGDFCTIDTCIGNSCLCTHSDAVCEDGFFCTGTETCSAGMCQNSGNPCNPPGICDENLNQCLCSTAGQCDDGNVCTDDSCVSGACQYANNTASCSDGNVCTTGDTCDFGYCVGEHVTNCCNAVADCNDYNACTNDACSNNVCSHTHNPAGTPCGSSSDDACTDPDTCNASGQCLTHDTANGADCGGPNCLGGQCGATTYRAELLPEGGNIGSEPRGGAVDGVKVHIVGRVIAIDEVDHAAVWTCDAPYARNCTLTQLPDGSGAPPSVANGIACNGAGTCVAVGQDEFPIISLPRPAVWFQTGPCCWTPESVPLPAGSDSGVMLDVATTADGFTAVGWSTDPQGFRQATYWERDPQSWTVHALPAFSIAGRESVATGIAVCPEGAPQTLCEAGARLVAGWAEDGPGIARPMIWRESGIGSDLFVLAPLPLPPGATQAADENPCTLNVGAGPEPNLRTHCYSGLELSDGTTRGVAWTSPDFLDWMRTEFPPLPGYDSSTLTDCHACCDDNGIVLPGRTCDGTSYAAGTNPVSSGVATRWKLDPNGWDVVKGPTDMNDIVSGLPVSSKIWRIWGSVDVLNVNFGDVLVDISSPMPFPDFSLPGPVPAAAGTPHPHAAVFIAISPAGIPTVSAWGMAVMTLLVLGAGTIVLRRAMHRSCDPFRVG